MKKKMKCMADGGMPQERPKKEEAIPEWKKSLSAAWQAIAGNREPPKEKPPTADSLGDTANRIKDRGRQLQEIASYANGGMPGQVEAFQAGVKPMAVSTGITPPNMVPTEAQGLAAVGAPTGGALAAAAQQAPITAATPGNVFANPQAGNMLTPSGGSMTMAEKSRAAGLDPNAAYRAGSDQDPHASGLSGPTAAQRIAGSNASAAALASNQQVPQVSNAIEMTSSRQRRQTATPGLADGGMVRYQFEGEGGPRTDDIPVKVANSKIKVSDGEQAVILPAKTAQNPQAIAAIGQVIEQSNDGRKPAMGMSQGGKYEDGSYPYDGKKPPTAQEVYAPVPYGLSAAFPNTAQALRDSGAATQQAVDQGRYGAATGQTARGMITGGIGLANDVVGSAASLLDYPANALKTFVTGDNAPARETIASAQQKPSGMAPTQQIATYSNEGRPSAIQTANTTPDPRIAQNTGNAGDARVDPASGNLHFTQKGFDPTQQQFAPGSGAITDPKTGRTILVAPQAIAQAPDNAPRDRHGNDMTQTLALRDELNRARADRAWSDMNSVNPGYQQQGMAKLQALAQIGALDTESMKRLGIQQSNAANLPEADKQLKGQAIAQGGMALQQANELNALYAAHNAEQNPDKRSMIAEQIRVRTGKDRQDKPIAVDMGETISADGMMKAKNPNVLYDPSTRQTIQLNGGQSAYQGFTKSEVDAAIKAGASKEAVIARIKSMGKNPKDYGL